MNRQYSKLHGLCDLLPETIVYITRNLELTDHFSFCISLCGGIPSNLLCAARIHFRARVRRLSAVWKLVYVEWIPKMSTFNAIYYIPLSIRESVVQREVGKLLRDFRTSFSVEQLCILFGNFMKRHKVPPEIKAFPPPPTVFAANMRFLGVGSLDCATVDIIADELPHTFWLYIIQDRRHTKFDKIHHLPDNIARCGSVRRLILRISGLSMISEGVLSMSKLNALHILDTEVSVLPEDIGTRLSGLQRIEIHRCPISTLPTSLLLRMENYLLCSDISLHPFHDFKAPIILNDTNISREYLNSVLKPGEFDRLRAACQRMGYL